MFLVTCPMTKPKPFRRRSMVTINSRNSPANTPSRSSPKRAPNWRPPQKKESPSSVQVLLAQDQEIQQLIARFQRADPHGALVQQLEVLIRAAIFKPANELVGMLLQAAADRIDATYQARPGQQRKGRESLQVDGIFGSFRLHRDYYYHPGKKQGHYPADVALAAGLTATMSQSSIMKHNRE
jgi:hypothetical protein